MIEKDKNLVRVFLEIPLLLTRIPFYTRENSQICIDLCRRKNNPQYLKPSLDFVCTNQTTKESTALLQFLNFYVMNECVGVPAKNQLYVSFVSKFAIINVCSLKVFSN